MNEARAIWDELDDVQQCILGDALIANTMTPIGTETETAFSGLYLIGLLTLLDGTNYAITSKGREVYGAGNPQEVIGRVASVGQGYIELELTRATPAQHGGGLTQAELRELEALQGQPLTAVGRDRLADLERKALAINAAPADELDALRAENARLRAALGACGNEAKWERLRGGLLWKLAGGKIEKIAADALDTARGDVSGKEDSR